MAPGYGANSMLIGDAYSITIVFPRLAGEETRRGDRWGYRLRS